MSWFLVHAALEGLHPNEFQSDIRRGTLSRNFLCYHWEGCMWNMQCHVEFGYQLSICSGTKETPWSSLPVAGPSGCKLTSSQQSGIKYASPNLCWSPLKTVAIISGTDQTETVVCFIIACCSLCPYQQLGCRYIQLGSIWYQGNATRY
jgi:hypothetical protein